MNTAELIAALQKVDPTGDKQVVYIFENLNLEKITGTYLDKIGPRELHIGEQNTPIVILGGEKMVGE